MQKLGLSLAVQKITANITLAAKSTSYRSLMEDYLPLLSTLAARPEMSQMLQSVHFQMMFRYLLDALVTSVVKQEPVLDGSGEWIRKRTGCRKCFDCHALDAFLECPDRTYFYFYREQPERGHLEGVLKTLAATGLVQTVTDRKGTQLGLIVTKINRRFDTKPQDWERLCHKTRRKI